jgi:hypothetical protein
MDPNAANEMLKIASGFGLVGFVAVFLGNKFLKSSEAREARMQLIADEDRKWRNEIGEKMMLQLAAMTQTVQLVTETNRALSESNSKLALMLEDGRK